MPLGEEMKKTVFFLRQHHVEQLNSRAQRGISVTDGSEDEEKEAVSVKGGQNNSLLTSKTEGK